MAQENSVLAPVARFRDAVTRAQSAASTVEQLTRSGRVDEALPFADEITAAARDIHAALDDIEAWALTPAEVAAGVVYRRRGADL